MSKADPPSIPYLAWRRRRRRDRIAVRAAQVGLLAVFLLAWEALPRLHLINPLLTSRPTALLPTVLELLRSTPYSPGLVTHIQSTVIATVVGFSGAMALGALTAIALWWWTSLGRILEPYLVVANAMPKTAFVPIFYLWLGAAASVYGMSLAISLFVTILMIHSGLQAAEPNKIKLARTFGATRAQVLAKVVLPGSVPTMIATLKVTVGLSLVGVVVGEFQSGNVGLGFLIQYGSQIYRMDIVMTAIVILAIVSSLLYLAIAWLDAAVMRRR